MKQIEVVNKGTNAETAIRLAPASEIAERLDRIEGSLKRTAGRTGRIENSFTAIVDRLKTLEDKICRLTKTVYNIIIHLPCPLYAVCDRFLCLFIVFVLILTLRPLPPCPCEVDFLGLDTFHCLTLRINSSQLS